MSRVIVEPILSPVLGPHLPFLGEVRQLAAKVADTVADSIWRVTVIDSGGVEIEKANHAARDAQKEPRQHYELLTDS